MDCGGLCRGVSRPRAVGNILENTGLCALGYLRARPHYRVRDLAPDFRRLTRGVCVLSRRPVPECPPEPGGRLLCLPHTVYPRRWGPRASMAWRARAGLAPRPRRCGTGFLCSPRDSSRTRAQGPPGGHPCRDIRPFALTLTPPPQTPRSARLAHRGSHSGDPERTPENLRPTQPVPGSSQVNGSATVRITKSSRRLSAHPRSDTLRPTLRSPLAPCDSEDVHGPEPPW